MRHTFWRPRIPAVHRLSAALCLWLLLLPPLFAAPGAHGPDGEHLDTPDLAVQTTSPARLPDGSVNLPKLAQRRMAIRTLLTAKSAAAATFQLPGRVIVDPNASGRVQAVHAGRVEAGPKGLPVAGQSVRQGDVLAYVRHIAEPYARGAQQAQLAELRAARQLAERRVMRLEALEGTVPLKEIEVARSDAKSLAERERSIHASLGVRDVLIAPVTGVIARADVVLGQIVESRAVLFEVIDPARMLVEATTADVAVATRIASASLQGMPEVRLRLLGAARSLRDGVLPITFSASPTEAETGESASRPMILAIGQPVAVLAQTEDRITGVVLPAAAVVRSAANEAIVWIKAGAERFIPQPVQYRSLDASSVVVTQGLGADDRVVVEGAALIAQIR